MSPEGLICNIYGEKTDIWAFGILIYEMLNGETPFCHCANDMELKQNIVRPIPEFKWRKNVNLQLKQLVNAMLEIN